MFFNGQPVCVIKSSTCAQFLGFQLDILETNNAEDFLSNYFSRLQEHATNFAYSFCGVTNGYIIFKRNY